MRTKAEPIAASVTSPFWGSASRAAMDIPNAGQRNSAAAKQVCFVLISLGVSE